METYRVARSQFDRAMWAPAMRTVTADGESLEARMRQHASWCVDAAKRAGYVLDYSAKSIDAVESKVPLAQAQIEAARQLDAARSPNTITAETLTRVLTNSWGAYLGETIRRHCKATWVVHEGRPGLLMSNEWIACPHHKVEQRLRNGPADTLVGFFRLTITPQFAKLVRGN